MDPNIFLQIASDEGSAEQLRRAFEDRRPFVRVSEHEFEEILILLRTALDERDLPVYVKADVVGDREGRRYLVSAPVFYTRPDPSR